MLAESAEAFGNLGFHYPVAFALAAAAFLALLLLEHVVLPDAAHHRGETHYNDALFQGEGNSVPNMREIAERS